jgi:hypothetical protein
MHSIPDRSVEALVQNITGGESVGTDETEMDT